MSRPVKARRLTQDEGTYLLRLVRRGRADTCGCPKLCAQPVTWPFVRGRRPGMIR